VGQVALLLALAAAEPWDRSVSVDAHMSYTYAPFGAAGVSVGYTMAKSLTVDVGLGRGNDAWRTGVMLRFHRGWTRVHFGVGGGLSLGRAVQLTQCNWDVGVYFFMFGGCSASREDGNQDLDRAWFGHGELALDVRSLYGFHYRLSLGRAWLLNRDAAWRCADRCEPPRPVDTSHLYVDMAMGWSF